MTALVLNSTLNCVGEFDNLYTDNEIKNEPMLFSCGIAHAMNFGGKITQQFLSSLVATDEYYCATMDADPNTSVIVDSRVHMLMPGWYPCIPGWHHDDIDRGGLFNQPEYGKDVHGRDMQSKYHFMGLVNAHIAPTEFIVGSTILTDPDNVPNVYEKWHQEIEWSKRRGHHQVEKAESGKIYEFNQFSMHRGTQAVSSGWRWFIRVTVGSNRRVTNEIRNQVQTYIPVENKGW